MGVLLGLGLQVSTEHKTQNTQQNCKTFTTWQHRKWKTLIKSDLFFGFLGPLHWHCSRVCHHPTSKKAASSSSSSQSSPLGPKVLYKSIRYPPGWQIQIMSVFYYIGTWGKIRLHGDNVVLKHGNSSQITQGYVVLEHKNSGQISWGSVVLEHGELRSHLIRLCCS